MGRNSFIKRMCKLRSVFEANSENCPMINIYEPQYFYPITYEDWKLIFQKYLSENTVKLWNKSYAIHIWNNLSKSRPVRIGSGVPYEIAARENCPMVYSVTKTNKYDL